MPPLMILIANCMQIVCQSVSNHAINFINVAIELVNGLIPPAIPPHKWHGYCISDKCDCIMQWDIIPTACKIDTNYLCTTTALSKVLLHLISAGAIIMPIILHYIRAC